MNDTIAAKTIMSHLLDRFGVVETERFVSVIMREPFDYTKWQRGLYNNMTVDELLTAADEWKNGKIPPS